MVSRFLFIFLNESVSTEKGISVLFNQGISTASQEGARLNAVMLSGSEKLIVQK